MAWLQGGDHHELASVGLAGPYSEWLSPFAIVFNVNTAARGGRAGSHERARLFTAAFRVYDGSTFSTSQAFSGSSRSLSESAIITCCEAAVDVIMPGYTLPLFPHSDSKLKPTLYNEGKFPRNGLNVQTYCSFALHLFTDTPQKGYGGNWT